MSSPGPGAGIATIRQLFSRQRPIDRPIEKVIDYYATDAHRLRAEVEEYEVTETGIWVSGFYGSGKSSFTKYLGFALNGAQVGERSFLHLLAERINAPDVKSELRTLAQQEPVAVLMLDLGSEQLASSATASISTVLYWKVLQWAGYSRVDKIAHLESRLERDGRMDEFLAAHQTAFTRSWESVHNDPLAGVQFADQLVSRFYPQEFPVKGDFSKLRFALTIDVRQQVVEMLDLIRRKSGRQNVLFLIDEAGQYVAPRGELILNMDGLARNIKEVGKGRAWIVATGQQTLTEIVEKAAYNSQELNKLRDRFPIAIELHASDIREITWKRLLTKSGEGEAALADLYRRHGQALAANTRLAGTPVFKSELDEQIFVRLYPFLPQHFDLLMELVRVLARSTGGIGLRSAIRVIQDVLVDTSKALPPGAVPLADCSLGRLATVEGFFDTLRADILKVLPHVVAGVDRVAVAFPNDVLAARVAKAIAALQPIENFPRTAEHIAALLYPEVGAAPHLDAVRETLRRLLETKELGLVDDPQAGGAAFLSDGLKPIVSDRNGYTPTSAEVAQLRSRVLRSLFETSPSATLEGAKTVKAGVRYGKSPITEDGEEVQFQLEAVSRAIWEERRTALLTETIGHPEWRATIAWLIRPDESVDDALVEVVRCQYIRRRNPEGEAAQDVAAYLRSERAAEQKYEERARNLYAKALLEGTLIFKGAPTAAGTAGATVEAAARKVLGEAAARIYPQFHLVNIRPGTDLAARFLDVSRLDHMPRDRDPLGFVTLVGGAHRVDPQHAALAEALRVFAEQLQGAGTGRLLGSALQDRFFAAPYGWSKDATRYVFAALLVAGEVVLHTAAGAVKTTGPAALDAMRNTLSFAKAGVSLRDSRPTNEALDRAASRLQEMTGHEVLPLETDISAAVRRSLPALLEPLPALPERLRLLRLAGAERSAALLAEGRALQDQDGAAAIAALGAPESAFPTDLAWATAVARALDQGADREVTTARSLLDACLELERNWSSLHVLDDGERDTARDLLASESFHEHLPELRGLVRQIRDRVGSIYSDEWNAHMAALARALRDLEADEAWIRLAEEDRAAIAKRLASDLPGQVEDGQETIWLARALIRRVGLPALAAELRGEIQRRQPPVSQAVDENGSGEPIDIQLSSLASSMLLRTDDDLQVWLDQVAAAIRNSMLAGAPVRIVVRP
ncbi:MAG TPA: BREX system P-loop protein BrxC [Chloroflexota bacterium]|nr:BREX system P-loop protein BrxC [Chloroflexota bacterium]